MTTWSEITLEISRVQRCTMLKKAGVGSSRSGATSFLRRWVTLRFCVVHGPFAVDCFRLPKAASAISLWSRSLEVQKHTTTLMRGFCNPLILTASMVHKMHPLRPCQNQNKLQQAYLTPLHVLHQILVCSNVVPMSCFAEIKHVSLVTSQTALRFRDLFIPRFSWLGFLPKCLFPKMIVSYVLMGARCLLCSIHVPFLDQIRWKTMKKHTMW